MEDFIKNIETRKSYIEKEIISKVLAGDFKGLIQLSGELKMVNKLLSEYATD